MYRNSSACHAYVMWAELVTAILYMSNVVTTGNEHKKCFKMEPCALVCV